MDLATTMDQEVLPSIPPKSHLLRVQPFWSYFALKRDTGQPESLPPENSLSLPNRYKWNPLPVTADCSHPLGGGRPAVLSVRPPVQTQSSKCPRDDLFSYLLEQARQEVASPPPPAQPSPACLGPCTQAVLPNEGVCVCAPTCLVSTHSVERSHGDRDAAAAKSR